VCGSRQRANYPPSEDFGTDRQKNV